MSTNMNEETPAGTIKSLELPFKHHELITNELEEDFKKIRVLDKSLPLNIVQNKLRELCSWLSKTPESITYRINTNVTDAPEIRRCLCQQFQIPPQIRMFTMPEMIMIHGWDNSVELDLEYYPNEVTVDATCGAAVLRGAHVFAAGVMSMPPGLRIDDKVSVFADPFGNCRKGAKTFEDAGKVFLGNGLVKKNRRDLFNEGACPSGIAVYITATRSRLPQLGDCSVTSGHAVLQNPPSIICSRILDPQPDERVLDMCAAPGNKTTHLSALMNGRGTLIALEKIKSKIPRLRHNCDVFMCRNVKIWCFDATKAVREDDHEEERDHDEPPFVKESFDRILLDGPCSGLGQRPQLVNKISPKELRSYVPLQRKLFSAAVELLNIGGVLVYSTCTVTIAENEGMVAWALRNFPELKLSATRDILEPMELDEKYRGSSGYSVDGLNENESEKLLRFGPESETVGFFIARFVKTNRRITPVN